MSHKYYDEHAQEYYTSSANADMSEPTGRFLSHIPKGSSILDAGSGTGRDTKIFLDLGYQVSAFDASIEMVKLSSIFTGIQTLHMTFEEIGFENQFDGIWACASLLHVDRLSLDEVFIKLRKALKPNGVIYCSFKSRDSDYTKDGRNFTCFTKDALLAYILQLNHFKIVDLWESADVRENREFEMWVNAILTI
ncbi:MAG: methyltransferase domain-containing protein [Erysipelotrichaceae bacterium]